MGRGSIHQRDELIWYYFYAPLGKGLGPSAQLHGSGHDHSGDLHEKVEEARESAGYTFESEL